jgi:hypothetical protein
VFWGGVWRGVGWVGGGGAGCLAGRSGWALVSSRAGVWASVPPVGSGCLVGRPGGPLVGCGLASLVYVRTFSQVFT